MRFYIPEENIENLEKKLWRIRGKCERAGLSFTYEKGERFFEEVEGKKECRALYPIDVEGHIHWENWAVCGVVQHMKYGNVLHSFAGMGIPDRYRTAGCHCDHCGVNRKRNETVIIYNENTKEFKQVGKTCLKEYTGGIDAAMIAALEEYEHEPCDFVGFGPSGKVYYNTREYLKYVVACVDLFGWRSKTKVLELLESLSERQYWSLPKNERHSTSQYAALLFNGASYVEVSPDDAKAVEDYLKLHSTEVEERVENALEYTRNHGVDDEFWGNLKVITQAECFEARNSGFAACAIMVYDRAQKKLEQAKKEKEEHKNIEFFGVVGNRYKLTGVLEFKTQFTTMYGEMFIYQMKVGNNLFVWKTSVMLPESVLGKEIELTGTVKEHKEYRGVNQTYLSRCKVG